MSDHQNILPDWSVAVPGYRVKAVTDDMVIWEVGITGQIFYERKDAPGIYTAPEPSPGPPPAGSKPWRNTRALVPAMACGLFGGTVVALVNHFAK